MPPRTCASYPIAITDPAYRPVVDLHHLNLEVLWALGGLGRHLWPPPRRGPRPPRWRARRIYSALSVIISPHTPGTTFEKSVGARPAPSRLHQASAAYPERLKHLTRAAAFR